MQHGMQMGGMQMGGMNMPRPMWGGGFGGPPPPGNPYYSQPPPAYYSQPPPGYGHMYAYQPESQDMYQPAHPAMVPPPPPPMGMPFGGGGYPRPPLRDGGESAPPTPRPSARLEPMVTSTPPPRDNQAPPQPNLPSTAPPPGVAAQGNRPHNFALQKDGNLVEFTTAAIYTSLIGAYISGGLSGADTLDEDEKNRPFVEAPRHRTGPYFIKVKKDQAECLESFDTVEIIEPETGVSADFLLRPCDEFGEIIKTDEEKDAVRLARKDGMYRARERRELENSARRERTYRLFHQAPLPYNDFDSSLKQLSKQVATMIRDVFGGYLENTPYPVASKDSIGNLTGSYVTFVQLKKGTDISQIAWYKLRHFIPIIDGACTGHYAELRMPKAQLEKIGAIQSCCWRPTTNDPECMGGGKCTRRAYFRNMARAQGPPRDSSRSRSPSPITFRAERELEKDKRRWEQEDARKKALDKMRERAKQRERERQAGRPRQCRQWIAGKCFHYGRVHKDNPEGKVCNKGLHEMPEGEFPFCRSSATREAPDYCGLGEDCIYRDHTEREAPNPNPQASGSGDEPPKQTHTDDPMGAAVAEAVAAQEGLSGDN